MSLTDAIPEMRIPLENSGLPQLTRLYRMLSEADRAIFAAADEEAMLQDICAIAVEHGGFEASWAGLRHARGDAMRIAGAAGVDTQTLRTALEKLDGVPDGRPLTAAVLREKTPQVCNDVLGNPGIAAIHGAAREHNFRSMAIFPLLRDEEVIGTFNLFAAEIDFFGPRLIDLLRQLAVNLSFALEKITGQNAHQAAEACLRESEERFRGTFEQAAVGIAHVGTDGSWLRVNSKLAQIVGYTREELLGLTFQNITHPADLNADLELMQDVLAGRRANYSLEKRYRRKDGSLIWIDLTVSLVRDAQAEPKYFISVIEDISERKLAEAALQRRNHELAVINALGTHVSLTLEPAEVISAALNRIMGSVSPNLALFYLHREGELRLQQSRFTDIQFAEEDAATKKVGECLCGLAAAQRRAVIAADIHRDPRCSLSECKEAGLRSFAALPLLAGDELLGVLSFAWREQIDLADREVFLQALAGQAAIGLNNAILHQKVRSHAEELEKKVAERTTALTEKKHELEGLVTSLNRQTFELERANSKLQEIDRLKSMFIASMSHELRTPLNSVIGFSSILLDEWVGPLNTEQKENLGTVLRTGKHLLSLINDVIDVSKIEAGQLDVQLQDFDLHGVMSEAAELMEKEIRDRGLEFQATFLHQPLHADRTRLLQCLLNLLGNAAKYTLRGEVRFGAQLLEANGPLEIFVRDTGIGIAPEDRQHLLQPFVRLESPLKKRVPGTGLGLFLTRKLTEDVLGGEFGFTSAPGQGSCFYLKLPVTGRR